MSLLNDKQITPPLNLISCIFYFPLLILSVAHLFLIEFCNIRDVLLLMFILMTYYLLLERKYSLSATVALCS